MHQGFWGLTVLALVLLGHGAYVWHTAGRSRPGWGVWLPLGLGVRSEERRVGKECVSTCGWRGGGGE